MDLGRLSPELVLELPVDRLGLELLAALTAGEGAEYFNNLDSVVRMLEAQLASSDQVHAATRAVEEGIGWLQTRV